MTAAQILITASTAVVWLASARWTVRVAAPRVRTMLRSDLLTAAADTDR